MPDDLHQELTEQARDRGMSLNSLLLQHLHDIARVNRHLTARTTSRQEPHHRG